jgi:Ser/Thr protein kinase RdoA (MazF antagonist)
LGKREVTGDSSQEVREFLANYGLESGDLRFNVLEGGEDNLNLCIELNQEKFVLRQYNITDKQEIEAELHLIAFLFQHGFPTAPVLARTDGILLSSFLGKGAALFRFVQGEPPQNSSVEIIERVVIVIAKLHQLTQGKTFFRTRSRTDMNRLLLLEEFAAQPSALDDRSFSDLLKHTRAFQRLFTSLSAHYQSILPTGVVHHDIHPGNILLNADGEVVALLDFDEAYVSYFLTDLANLLHYWGSDTKSGALNMPQAGQIISLYHQYRPLHERERALLPDFLLLSYLADAAEYVQRALTKNINDHPVERCRSYQKFLLLSSQKEWRKALLFA